MTKKLYFNEYSDLTQEKFTDLNDFRVFSKICLDTYKNRLQKYSVDEANTVIRNKIREIMGLGENPTVRQIKKALNKTAIREAVFEILEETLDDVLVTGWGNDPFFNKYVEMKNMLLGDKNAFYIKDDVILHISKVSGGHHNIERQRLAGGSMRTVATQTYGVKIYAEYSRFVQGVEDWTTLVNKIAESFTRYINTMIHDAVMSASEALPVPEKWNVKGQAAPANKKRFKQLISDVKLATGSNVTIWCTDVAASELANFGNVEWISNDAKNDVYKTGRIATFEGTPVAIIPQAFEYNDVTKYLESDTKILIMPDNMDRPLKMCYEGSESIVEKTQYADRADDTLDYEFQTTFGVEVITGQRFGCWTLES